MSSRAAVELAAAAAAARSIIYLGLDVHKDSITIAVLPEGAKTPSRVERLPNELPKLRRWLERAAREAFAMGLGLDAAGRVLADILGTGPRVGEFREER